MQDEIHFDRPSSLTVALPYRIAAAGQTRAGRGTPPIRQRFNQHVLIVTLGGGGLIRLGGRAFAARPQTLAWLDTARRYEHGCAPDAETWHYLWLGVQGHGLDALFASLGLDNAPLTPLGDAAGLRALFNAAIQRLRTPGPNSAAENNATVAQLVALLIAARGGTTEDGSAPDTTMAALTARMRAGLDQPWPIATLAEAAHLSPAQLHRRFRQAYATTPMDWLRHERIHLAKRLLVGSGAKIASIAAACGYGDPYHFSRDFSRLTGQAPSAFRRAGGR